MSSHEEKIRFYERVQIFGVIFSIVGIFIIVILIS